VKSAVIFYPAMQAADLFKLDVQIAHAGMDQRKVHMLAHELAGKFGDRKFASVHGHLLPSLKGIERMDPSEEQQIDAKMSKSKPDSAVFIHDSAEDIKKKLMKAYCPEKTVEGNPVLEYAEHLILRDRALKIERPEKFGGDIEFENESELKKAFSEGKLHPMDLKNGVAAQLSQILAPCREYFEKNKQYLEQIAEVEITR
jgi:tyrosyl-tRNA synthetase